MRPCDCDIRDCVCQPDWLWNGADTQVDYYKGGKIMRKSNEGKIELGAVSELRHTPTPWTNDGSRIFSKKYGPIADVPHYFGDRTEKTEANRTFIVKAVNNHEALKRSLAAMVSFINEQIEDDAIDFDCFPGLIDSVHEAEEALKQAGEV